MPRHALAPAAPLRPRPRRDILSGVAAICLLATPVLADPTAPAGSDHRLDLFVLNAQGKTYAHGNALENWVTTFKPDALLMQEDGGNMGNALSAAVAAAHGLPADRIVGGDMPIADGQRIRSLIGGEGYFTNSDRYMPVRNPATGKWELELFTEPRATAKVTKGGQTFDLMSVHFKGDDLSVGTNSRRDVAKDAALIGKMVQSFAGPMIMGGDFNAGDTSATGLRPGQTYPTANNLPVTMNILKKSVQLFQSDSEREPFAYQEDGDSTYTWPNPGYGCSTTSGCWGGAQRWDRAKIDHVVIARPYAKWFYDAKTESDLAADLELREINTGGIYSDHSPASAKMGWVMPLSEQIDAADPAAGVRLTFDARLGEQAAQAGDKADWYDAERREFHLSRNNRRSDVYLGQISDDAGRPVLSSAAISTALGLSDPAVRARLGAQTGLDFDNDPNAVFKIRLDCGDAGHLALSGAGDLCTDDHSRFKEIVVADGQTVVVDEAAALGSAQGGIRLNDGGLRTAGKADTWSTVTAPVGEIAQKVDLAGTGWLDVTDADDQLTMAGTISGTGDLHKRGQGTLVLAADNSYTGATTVESGTLLVNGSIAASTRTDVLAGAALGGTGRVGDLHVQKSGTIMPGDLGIGTLTVDGALQLDGGILNIDIGAAGHDLLRVAGDFGASEPYAIRFNFLDGFIPDSGSVFEFLKVDGTVAEGIFDLATLLLPEGDDYFGLSLFHNADGAMALAWADPYELAPAPVPVPAAMPMLLVGLAGLGILRRRKAA